MEPEGYDLTVEEVIYVVRCVLAFEFLEHIDGLLFQALAIFHALAISFF